MSMNKHFNNGHVNKRCAQKGENITCKWN